MWGSELLLQDVLTPKLKLPLQRPIVLRDDQLAHSVYFGLIFGYVEAFHSAVRSRRDLQTVRLHGKHGRSVAEGWELCKKGIPVFVVFEFDDLALFAWGDEDLV